MMGFDAVALVSVDVRPTVRLTAEVSPDALAWCARYDVAATFDDGTVSRIGWAGPGGDAAFGSAIRRIAAELAPSYRVVVV